MIATQWPMITNIWNMLCIRSADPLSVPCCRIAQRLRISFLTVTFQITTIIIIITGSINLIWWAFVVFHSWNFYIYLLSCFFYILEGIYFYVLFKEVGPLVREDTFTSQIKLMINSLSNIRDRKYIQYFSRKHEGYYHLEDLGLYGG
jgi:hypothetical protein